MQRFCVKDKTHRAAATQEQKMKKDVVSVDMVPEVFTRIPTPKTAVLLQTPPENLFPHFPRVVVIHEPTPIRLKREAINTACLSSDLFHPQMQGGNLPRNPQGSFCGRKQSQNYTTKSPPFRVSVRFGWKRNFSIRANFSWSPVPTPRAHAIRQPTTSGAAPAPPHHRFDQACVRWS